MAVTTSKVASPSTTIVKSATWYFLRREIIKIVAVLLFFEFMLRLPPIHTALTTTLDPYENALWYSAALPVYEKQLQEGRNYTVWMVGSSYMMSGLNPEKIQTHLQQNGYQDFTVQNYGMAEMVSFQVMADVYDRWMFQMAQPRYIVLATSEGNFSPGALSLNRILTSSYESLYIFPDSPDDYIAGFLFKNSYLFRYPILARNIQFVPREIVNMSADTLPLGGFDEYRNQAQIENQLDCAKLEANPLDLSSEWLERDMAGGFARLDYFIDIIQKRDIPIIIVNIPQPECTLRYNNYSDFENYRVAFIEPLREHLQDRGVQFHDLDTRFYSEIPLEEQAKYFMDSRHPNRRGAELLSQWTAEFVASWLQDQSL